MLCWQVLYVLTSSCPGWCVVRVVLMRVAVAVALLLFVLVRVGEV